MFGRAIWDKLHECIFENSEIVRVKNEVIKTASKTAGNSKLTPFTMSITMNHVINRLIFQ